MTVSNENPDVSSSRGDAPASFQASPFVIPALDQNIMKPGAMSPPRTSLLVKFAALVVVLWGLVQAHSFLVPLFFACLLALLMMPLIRVLQKWRWPEWLIVVTSSLIMIAPFIIGASLMVSEGRKLASDWPQLEATVKHDFEGFLNSSWAQGFDLRGRLDGESVTSHLGERAGEGMRWVLMSVTKVFSFGSHTVLVLFFAVVMLASRVHFRNAMEKIMTHYESFDKAHTLDAATEVLEQFLAARLFIILFVAVADFIILKCFGIPYSTILSLVLGIMTLVPVLGFFVGVLPVLLVTLAQSFSPLAMVAVFLCVGSVSSLQDHILAPKLIGKKLNLNFLMTYVAIFAGERLWGISGMFLGVPILGVIRILLNASDNLQPWGYLLQERTEDASSADGETTS